MSCRRQDRRLRLSCRRCLSDELTVVHADSATYPPWGAQPSAGVTRRTLSVRHLRERDSMSGPAASATKPPPGPTPAVLWQADRTRVSWRPGHAPTERVFPRSDRASASGSALYRGPEPSRACSSVDRASASEAEGRRSESCRARHCNLFGQRDERDWRGRWGLFRSGATPREPGARPGLTAAAWTHKLTDDRQRPPSPEPVTGSRKSAGAASARQPPEHEERQVVCWLGIALEPEHGLDYRTARFHGGRVMGIAGQAPEPLRPEPRTVR